VSPAPHKTTQRVPFVDLRAQYLSIQDDVDSAIARVIDNTAFILGEEVAAFEREFAEFTGFRHVIGVANGTDAIHIALRACGLRRGDEVVAPAHTFVATTEAITQAEGEVRLADVSDVTFCMSAETLEPALSPRTRFVIPVGIYGNLAGLDRVVELARSRGVKVLVDAAQAHGARLHGKRLGELVDVATYSFYPGKNLGAFGDAGAVATNDDDVARRVRMWRDHGREGKFDHEFEAVNSRLDGLQAAILRAKLPHLARWCDGRRTVAAAYREALSGLAGVRLPEETPGAEHVYHLFVVRLDGRDRVRERLREAGIESGIHYPKPIHHLTAYSRLAGERLPQAEAICGRILSLPMYPELDASTVGFVADTLETALAG
jgi:dTDP-4-amino-4,6-dideoxygalactose transaminase